MNLEHLRKRPPFLVFVFFSIPFTLGIVYLLSFYPAIMSYDSIYQWDELSQFRFTNWHPAYHTILLWLITRIYFSPVSLALFQVAMFSSVMAYGLWTLRDVGVPALLLILLDFFISILPMNGMMEITLWKDILYSIAVLLLIIILFKIILSNGEWITRGRNSVFLGWFWRTLACCAIMDSQLLSGLFLLSYSFIPDEKHFFCPWQSLWRLSGL
jgi:hypothetical protein